jgi:uncharacterized membrane protein
LAVRARLRLAVGLGLLLAGLGTLLVAGFALGYEVAVVAVPLGVISASLVFFPRMAGRRRFLWFVVGTCLALGLGVEVLVLKGDIGRQNTVFKFYLQVWVMLSVVAGVSVAWMRERALHFESHWRKLWWIGMGLLICGGALFLPFGVRARALDRMSPQVGLTLDGMAFMEYGKVWDGDPGRGDGREISLAGDYAAIRWMQDTIQGSPVILEGVGYREYLWGNRVSIHTGLPAVGGWRWHLVQQYAALPSQVVSWRRDDVQDCYNTTDVRRAQEILTDYGVRYVYVGDYERAYYDPAGLAKFDQMAAQGMLRVVYGAQGVKIYEVVEGWMEDYESRSTGSARSATVAGEYVDERPGVQEAYD